MSLEIINSLVVTAAFSALVEGVFHRPILPNWWKRAVCGAIVGILIWVPLLALFFRPNTAAVLTCATIAVLHAVSFGKKRLLNEPLVFSDLALVSIIVHHPRLYIHDRTSLSLAIGGAFGSVMALSIMLVVDAPMHASGVLSRILPVGLAVGIGWLFWWSSQFSIVARSIALLTGPPDLRGSVANKGLVPTLILFALCWQSDRHKTRTSAAKPRIPERPAFDDIVIVQFESFLDPSHLFPDEEPGPGLVKAREQAIMWGPLEVPALGAYTMRTEASVLTGLSSNELGFEQFDPYLSIEHPRVPSLAAQYRDLGYETIFVHPYDLRFYNRKNRMPRLGFERIVGEEAFQDAPRNGPYVSDPALADWIINELDRPQKKRGSFIFAVSMENHGPWKPERLPGAATSKDTWLAHLQSTDAAIEKLLDSLEARRNQFLFSFYGDHGPLLNTRPSSQGKTTTEYVICSLGEGSSQNSAPHEKHSWSLSDTISLAPQFVRTLSYS